MAVVTNRVVAEFVTVIMGLGLTTLIGNFVTGTKLDKCAASACVAPPADLTWIAISIGLLLVRFYHGNMILLLSRDGADSQPDRAARRLLEAAVVIMQGTVLSIAGWFVMNTTYLKSTLIIALGLDLIFLLSRSSNNVVEWWARINVVSALVIAGTLLWNTLASAWILVFVLLASTIVDYAINRRFYLERG